MVSKTQSPHVIGILGGGGFVGRYVVEALAKKNGLIKVGSRHPDEHLALKTAATIGKVQLHHCDIRSKESIEHFVRGCDVVINLVGTLFERRKETFQAIHTEGATMVASACAAAHVKQLIHISALGVDKSNPSLYAKTKAAGEESVRKIFPEAVILRPALIFGPEDKFFNKFAAMALISPCLPVFKRGRTEFQPVYVGDVAEAIEVIISKKMKGKTFELAGPDIFTFRELLEMTLDHLGKNRSILPMPTVVGYGISLLSKCMPEPLLTFDQLRLLNTNSTLSGKHPGLKELGIEPKKLHDILPSYLKRFA